MRLLLAVWLLIAGTYGVLANNLGAFGTPSFQPISATITAVDNNNSLSNVGTVTFTAEPIGPALGDRYILVAYHQRNDTGSAPSTVSASIGGISASLLGEFAQSSNSTIGFIIAPVPTGTTADVTLNFSAATVDSAGIFVYSLNQLVRPANVIGTGTLAATATNPAVLAGAASQGDAIEFYILRNTSNSTTETITPPQSGKIGAGGTVTTPCGTGTGVCYSGFTIDTGPIGGGVSDTRTGTAGNVGIMTITLR